MNIVTCSSFSVTSTHMLRTAIGTWTNLRCDVGLGREQYRAQDGMPYALLPGLLRDFIFHSV